MMETLTKSIDSLIDELFAEDEKVAKSMIKDANPAKETADEAVKQAPKAEKDEARGEGRPEQISDVPQTDTDGARSGEYDGKIAKKNEETKKKEDTQVEVPEQMKKAVSEQEWAEYQALKKAKQAAEETETLQKARKEQTDLIKAAVSEAVTSIKSENEELRKSIKEQNDLIKAMANKPQPRKAVTSMQAVEKEDFKKSHGSSSLSKAELLDVAEELMKSKKLSMENVIELENTGFIYDAEARHTLETAVKRRS